MRRPYSVLVLHFTQQRSTCQECVQWLTLNVIDQEELLAT